VKKAYSLSAKIHQFIRFTAEDPVFFTSTYPSLFVIGTVPGKMLTICIPPGVGAGVPDIEVGLTVDVPRVGVELALEPLRVGDRLGVIVPDVDDGEGVPVPRVEVEFIVGVPRVDVAVGGVPVTVGPGVGGVPVTVGPGVGGVPVTVGPGVGEGNRVLATVLVGLGVADGAVVGVGAHKPDSVRRACSWINSKVSWQASAVEF